MFLQEDQELKFITLDIYLEDADYQRYNNLLEDLKSADADGQSRDLYRELRKSFAESITSIEMFGNSPASEILTYYYIDFNIYNLKDKTPEKV